MTRIILVAVLFFTAYSLDAQHQEIPEKPGTWQGQQKKSLDSNTILFAFKSGTFNGHFRNYLMATDNERGLTDYYANASGGGLRYESAPYKGFQFAVSGFYIFNTASSNLELRDSATGQYNRYEIGLFDMENPANKKDNDRLEELYLKYNFFHSHITFGRQLINTPFINLQDGRMRPTGIEGIWFEFQEIKNLKFEGGWIYAISPRGTTRWYYTGEAVGLYPVGVNPDGTKSGYKSNLESAGIAMLGIQIQASQKAKIRLWEMYFDRIFNVGMVQPEYLIKTGKKGNLMLAGQFIRQDAVNNGGNKDSSRTYITKGGKSMTFGFRAGWKSGRFEMTGNYNRITTHGRYLMPREFGREPFFTFMPRERNEGLGDVHAFSINTTYNIEKYRLKTSLAAGYYILPDVKNYTLNKYGMPSYGQMNADVRYTFAGILEGLDLQLLVVGKIPAGKTYNQPIYVFNKVNMILYNLVLNYHF